MTDHDDPGPWDAGLQPERTSLAWLRTCLGLAGCALLTTRVFLVTDAWVAFGLVVIAIALCAGLVWWGAQRRARATLENLHSERGMTGRPGGRLLLVTAACACAITVANAALVFVTPTR